MVAHPTRSSSPLLMVDTSGTGTGDTGRDGPEPSPKPGSLVRHLTTFGERSEASHGLQAPTLRWIQEAMGHEPITATARIYAHFYDAELDAVVAALDGLFALPRRRRHGSRWEVGGNSAFCPRPRLPLPLLSSRRAALLGHGP